MVTARRSEAGRGRGNAPSSGFTLIETLAVIVVMSILLVAVASRLDTSEPAVIAEAQVLRSHLRYVQGLAMANNTEAWSLNVGAGSYTIFRGVAVAPVNLPGETSPTHNLPAGVSIAQGTGMLRIDEWGVPDQTRTLQVTDGRTQRSITILGLTGLIR
ncbi:MAG: type II secretion system protein [Lentisphaerae bacterium]|nr:type II secretion system protein [Lentisphaerota bacterium]